MLFNSFAFIVFYMSVIIMFYLIPKQSFRWGMLLLSSYVFYMWWKPVYIVLIMLSTLVDYAVGLSMEKNRNNPARKRALLFLSLLVNLGLLFTFKYFNYFGGLIGSLTYGRLSFSGLKLLLPMGISFYTFQTLSYSIDVYRGKIKAERHLGYFALYVSFFPQLVAGPIERSDRLLPQLKNPKRLNYERMRESLVTMGLGFFKKMVIADRAAVFVQGVFGNIESIHDGWEILLAVILFSFQIYCDFSGYSDIAIGSAKLLGIDLMTNFKQPYFAKSIREFWGKWHISLTSWFKDYLYIPLGGNRKGQNRTLLNVLIVFVISGIWHGANITFLVWGMLHGLFYAMETKWERHQKKLKDLMKIHEASYTNKIFRLLWTFMLVNVSWIFFRAQSLGEALQVLKRIRYLSWNRLYSIGEGFSERFYTYGLDKLELRALLISIIGLLVIDYAINRCSGVKGLIDRMQLEPVAARWAIYAAVVFSIIIFGVYGNGRVQEFIYFQF